jgi:hypothetical protein
MQLHIDFTPVFSGGTGRSGTTAIVNCLARHPEFHASMPREIRYLTDRAGLLDINFGRPLTFEASPQELRKRFLLRAYLLLGKCQKKIFIERISDSTPLNIQNSHRISRFRFKLIIYKYGS